MCGVLFVGGKKKLSDNQIMNVLKIQGHRGIDNLSFKRFEKFILGSNRLAFNDLSRNADMPMQHGPIEIVFNGEIYNFLDLKKILQEKNVFKNKSDTEVLAALLHNYDYGTAISKLRGTWSFIAYDKRFNNIIISRDQLGSKPLFYTYTDDTLIIASEVKTLLPFIKQINYNENKISEYLNNNSFKLPDYCSNNETFFEGINKFPANSYSIIKPGKFAKFKTQTITNFQEMSEAVSEKVDIQEISNTIEEIFKMYEISDHEKRAVPLSGGIDSNIILHHYKDNKNVKFFSLSTKNEIQEYSESNLIDKTLEKFNINHEYVNTEGSINEKNLKRVINACDMPINSLAPLTHLKLRDIFNEQNYKIFYSGSGGDEIFGGHSIQFSVLLNSLYKNKKYLNFFYKTIVQYSAGLNHKNSNIGFVDVLKGIFHNFNSWKKIKNEKIPILHDVIKFNIHLLTKRITPYNNSIEDGICSINSVECRTPFLDQNLFKLVLKSYDHKSFSGGKNKFLLREIYKQKLSKEVLNNKVKINLPSSMIFSMFNELYELSLSSLNQIEIDNKSNLINEFNKGKTLFQDFRKNIKLIKRIPASKYFKLVALNQFKNLYKNNHSFKI